MRRRPHRHQQIVQEAEAFMRKHKSGTAREIMEFMAERNNFHHQPTTYEIAPVLKELYPVKKKYNTSGVYVYYAEEEE